MNKDPYYKGELKAELTKSDPRSLNAARYVVDIIVERAIQQILMIENMAEVI